MTPERGLPAAQPNEAWSRRRVAAAKYRPARIRLLLVTGSPPADAERWFYFEDGANPDELFEEVCAVLFEQEPHGPKEPFLKELRRRGVFLAELKPDAPRREEPLAPYVAPFVLNLATLEPGKIVLIGAEVHDAAHAAIRRAGFDVVDVRVPFPSTGQEVKFRQAFRTALVRAGLEKLIRPLKAAKAPGKAKDGKAGA